MTNYLCFLIHMYQPPTQDIEILKKIDKECYKPLFKMIQERDNARFCLNINGVLVDMLYEYGLGDTMDLIKYLVKDKKLEVVGTAKFHPILPLIPEKEIIRQIELNQIVNEREFGKDWKRLGFFPPEMAISPGVMKVVKDLGYEWMIMSGIAIPTDWAYDKIYQSPEGLKLFFRDDILSNKISFNEIKPQEFINSLKNLYKTDSYSIIAQDAETYGHHIKNYEKEFLGKLLTKLKKEDEVRTCFISELTSYFPIVENPIIPKKSSWSTLPIDLEQNEHYPLWKHRKNDVHKHYWKIMKNVNKLIDLADNIEIDDNWEVDEYKRTSRWFYDMGLNSCPMWWANPTRGTWSPNLIYKGTELLIRAALNAQLALISSSKEEGREGEPLYDAITQYHGLLLMELMSVSSDL